MSRRPPASEEVIRLLRERAEKLACEAEDPRGERQTVEVVEFGLAAERYALETAYVREVHPLQDLTPLPSAPSFLAGLVNIRGRIVAVLDIKRFFDLPEKGITDAHHLLLVESEQMELGILADTIIGVRSIGLEAIQPALPTLSGLGEAYLKGVTVEPLIILDAVRILGDERILIRDESET